MLKEIDAITLLVMLEKVGKNLELISNLERKQLIETCIYI